MHLYWQFGLQTGHFSAGTISLWRNAVKICAEFILAVFSWTFFHVTSVHFKEAQAQIRQWYFCIMSKYNFGCCMVKFTLAFMNWVSNCAHRHRFSWVHPMIFFTEKGLVLFNAVPSEVQKTTAIQYYFSALFLVCKDFSGFSEYFDDIMYCRWYYFKYFTISC